jgi:hypothetical protein
MKRQNGNLAECSQNIVPTTGKVRQVFLSTEMDGYILIDFEFYNIHGRDPSITWTSQSASLTEQKISDKDIQH